MNKRPEVRNLRFRKCCQDALRGIDDAAGCGRVLQLFMPMLTFVVIFNSLGRGSFLTSTFTLTTMDWDGLLHATAKVPTFTRATCWKIAANEAMEHPGGELHRFWETMVEYFA